MTRVAFEDRFWAKVDKSGDCWIWTGATTDRGYGLIWHNGGSRPAYREAYEHFVGPVPDGLELDHLCRNPPCVNPAHLEPVTHAENVRRGDGPTAANARKTHCAQGHPLSGDNLYVIPTTGSRQCRACAKATHAARYRRFRDAGLIALALLSLTLFVGCAPAPPTPSSPSISRVLATPTEPLVFGWVMAHQGYDWWVQIGPKSDAAGYHVAVQGWISCQQGLTTVPTCASYDFFQRYDAPAPGSVHSYSIVWGPGGWSLSFDGRVLVVLDPGGPDAVMESNCCERTAA